MDLFDHIYRDLLQVLLRKIMQRPAHALHHHLRRHLMLRVHEPELIFRLLPAKNNESGHSQFLEEGRAFFLNFGIVHTIRRVSNGLILRKKETTLQRLRRKRVIEARLVDSIL